MLFWKIYFFKAVCFDAVNIDVPWFSSSILVIFIRFRNGISNLKYYIRFLLLRRIFTIVMIKLLYRSYGIVIASFPFCLYIYQKFITILL